MAKQSDQKTDSLPFYIPSSMNELVKVLATGIGVGLLIALFSELIARFVISPIFCGSTESFQVCSNGGNVAFYAATIVVNMAAVAVLVRLGVFRPLLVALGAAAILWGVRSYLADLNLVEYVFWLAMLYGLVYVLLFWLLRIRNFIIALVLTIVAIVLARLVIVA